MEAFFQGGLPARITREDFRRFYLANFPKLAEGHDDIIDQAIEAVYTSFHGVSTLWDVHDKQTWFDKTRLCYTHLTAWYICDMHPKYVAGVPVMGGVPIKRKKIGGVDITFQDSPASSSDLLSGLLSNPFGKQAYMMIKTCAKRTALR